MFERSSNQAEKNTQAHRRENLEKEKGEAEAYLAELKIKRENLKYYESNPSVLRAGEEKYDALIKKTEEEIRAIDRELDPVQELFRNAKVVLTETAALSDGVTLEDEAGFLVAMQQTKQELEQRVKALEQSVLDGGDVSGEVVAIESLLESIQKIKDFSVPEPEVESVVEIETAAPQAPLQLTPEMRVFESDGQDEVFAQLVHQHQQSLPVGHPLTPAMNELREQFESLSSDSEENQTQKQEIIDEFAKLLKAASGEIKIESTDGYFVVENTDTDPDLGSNVINKSVTEAEHNPLNPGELENHKNQSIPVTPVVLSVPETNPDISPEAFPSPVKSETIDVKSQLDKLRTRQKEVLFAIRDLERSKQKEVNSDVRALLEDLYEEEVQLKEDIEGLKRENPKLFRRVSQIIKILGATAFFSFLPNGTSDNTVESAAPVVSTAGPTIGGPATPDTSPDVDLMPDSNLNTFANIDRIESVVSNIAIPDSIPYADKISQGIEVGDVAPAEISYSLPDIEPQAPFVDGNTFAFQSPSILETPPADNQIEVDREAAQNPEIKPETILVIEGDKLINIAKEKFADLLSGLTTEQVDRVLHLATSGLSARDLETMGVQSGNEGLIFPGEHLNLEPLRNSIQDKISEIEAETAAPSTDAEMSEHDEKIDSTNLMTADAFTAYVDGNYPGEEGEAQLQKEVLQYLVEQGVIEAKSLFGTFFGKVFGLKSKPSFYEKLVADNVSVAKFIEIRESGPDRVAQFVKGYDGASSEEFARIYNHLYDIGASGRVQFATDISIGELVGRAYVEKQANSNKKT